MAFSLGSLFVDLKANTADFVEGMGKAAYASKQLGRDVSESLSSIGGVVGNLLSPLGQFGTVIGETLERVGLQAGNAISSFGKMGGAMNAVMAVGAGAAAALGAVELGAVGLAVHTAESINKMHELAQATGVPIEALSAFSFVAKQNGVDTETMSKGLEKLSKAAFAAATAPAGTTNAFTRMSIAVRDAGGSIRPVQDIFTDVAAKFAAMPDGVTKTALAMQLFGRGGAALIPVLNQGREGIQGMVDTAKALGVVIDDQTAAAAHQFELSLGEIKAGADGISISLTKELLPSLQALATLLADGMKDKGSGLNELISGFGYLTKIILATGDTIFSVLRQVGITIGSLLELIIEGVTATAKVEADIISHNFTELVSDSKDGYGRMKAVVKNFIDSSKDDWKAYADFTRNIVSPAKIAPLPKDNRHGGDGDAAAVEKDNVLARIQERIAALQRESEGWKAIASVGTQAEQLIAEAIKKGNEEFGKLSAEAAKDKTGAAQQYVQQNAAIIRAAGANAIFGKEVEKTVAALDKSKFKFDDQSNAALALAAAYEKGGAALSDAAIDKKLSAEHTALVQLTADYEQAKADAAAFAAEKAKLGGAAGPVPGKDISADSLALLKSGVDAASAAYDRLRESARKAANNELLTSLKIQQSDFDALKPKIDAVNASYLQGESAIRRATVALELQKFIQDEIDKNGSVSTDAIERKRKLLQDADNQALEGQYAQEAAQLSLNRIYDDSIGKLERVREVMVKNGQDTILIDAKIHDAQDSIIHQWDEAAFKVGTFSEKFKAVMGELVIQGHNAGQAMMQAWVSAIDGIESQFAKLLTGQKTNFKGVFQGLAEQLTKSQIQKGVGALAEHIPGLGDLLKSGQPLGSSSSNPMFVSVVSGLTTVGNGPIPLFGNISGESGSSLGGGFSSLLSSFFRGGLAGGGEMSPGYSYLVGERGPELMIPKSAGTVIPNNMLGGGTINHNTFNYNHSADRDLFGRTDRQNAARHMRNLRLATR